MKNNETGEFELVVGNRQLLSGFAIVVLLFGVGVAMGYILGQNSPRSAKLQPEGAVTSSVPDSRPQPAGGEAASSLPEAPPGNYWQVMALPQKDAEAVLHTLKDQGFPSLLSPGTKGLTRVLVGPYKDVQSMGKAKTQLEGNGFHPR